MHTKDIVPHNDDEVLAFSENLISKMEEHVTLWNVSPESYAKVQECTIAYRDALRKAKDPNHGKVDVLAKNNMKKDLIKEIRNFLKEFVLYNHLITEEDLVGMGLRPHDNTPTRAPIPIDKPVGEVDTSTHQQHTLRVKAGNLTGKSKPDTTINGFEVWRKVGGDAPATDEEWTYVDFSSRSTLIVKYPLIDVGKTVYYRFRWVNTRNEKGPWSEGLLIAIVP
jgi:hypothetical protein